MSRRITVERLEDRLVLTALGVTATLTADNHYALYLGQVDGSQLTLLGTNELGEAGNPGASNWSLPETWSFSVDEGGYIYVLAWDDGGPQMWSGQFTLSDGTSLFSDTTGWEFVVASGLNPTASGSIPTLATVTSDIAGATWEAPHASTPQGSSPWFGIPGLSPAAQMIWHDTLGDTSSSDSHYVIYRTIAPLVPISPNSPPDNLGLSLSAATIDENGTVTLDGTFTDADSDDSHTVVIEWGPGEQSIVLDLVAGVTSFQITHQYRDDNASGPGTLPDTYEIVVTVADLEGASTSAESSVTVNNVAPVITSLQNSAPQCGDTSSGNSINISGTFSDKGTLDAHSAVIDWGDGEVTAGDINALSVTGHHIYSQGGIYTITLTVSDDDGGVSNIFTTTAMITGVGVNNGILYVVGTKALDHVSVNRQGTGWFKVHADFLLDGNFTAQNSEGVRHIVAALCSNDDQLSIAGNIRVAKTSARAANPLILDIILDDWQPPVEEEE
jgi:hypothetical protein